MALAIKSIPVLKGEVAESFQDKLAKNSERRASIDFKPQMKATQKILAKSKGK